MQVDARQVRIRAGRKLLVSSWLLLVIPLIAYLTAYVKELRILNQLIVLTGAFICTPFLMHLLELIVGVPFADMSNRWDDLKGWQRGVIGIAGCGILITIVILVMGTLLPLIVP